MARQLFTGGGRGGWWQTQKSLDEPAGESKIKCEEIYRYRYFWRGFDAPPRVLPAFPSTWTCSGMSALPRSHPNPNCARDSPLFHEAQFGLARASPAAPFQQHARYCLQEAAQISQPDETAWDLVTRALRKPHNSLAVKSVRATRRCGPVAF